MIDTVLVASRTSGKAGELLFGETLQLPILRSGSKAPATC